MQTTFQNWLKLILIILQFQYAQWMVKLWKLVMLQFHFPPNHVQSPSLIVSQLNKTILNIKISMLMARIMSITLWVDNQVEEISMIYL